MINETLSELFFSGAIHPKYDEYITDRLGYSENIDWDVAKSLIAEDAKSFLYNYGSILPSCTAEELVESFMEKVPKGE